MPFLIRIFVAKLSVNSHFINSNYFLMTNNDILKKLRVALSLKNSDIIAILKLVDFNITESELGAIFRAEDHPNFKPCGDQLLRNFLNGLIIYKRGPLEKKSEPAKKILR